MTKYMFIGDGKRRENGHTVTKGVIVLLDHLSQTDIDWLVSRGYYKVAPTAAKDNKDK